MSFGVGLTVSPTANKNASVTVALMSAYTWLLANEPGLLEWLEDPIIELLGDTERAARIAAELNSPRGVEWSCAFGACGVQMATFPAYIWELTYPR